MHLPGGTPPRCPARAGMFDRREDEMQNCRQTTWRLILAAGVLLESTLAPWKAAAFPSVDTDDVRTHLSSRWFPHSPSKTAVGVALVIHGLNLKPEKMDAVIGELTENGIDCLRVSLWGHGTNYRPREGRTAEEARLLSFKNASHGIWAQETLRACRRAQAWSRQRNLPLYLVANSYGALIAIDLFTSRPEVTFDKMVLFAPALSLRARSHLIRLLAPFPSLVIPTFSPCAYLANRGTPMAAYSAVFETLANFSGAVTPKINVPTLVFIDPRDELVSAGGLADLVASHRLDRWRILPVEKNAPGRAGRIHHLIIDQNAVGPTTWRRMMDIMLDHLAAAAP